MSLCRGILDARSTLDLHQAKINPFGTETVERTGLTGKGEVSINAVFGVADEDIDA